MSLRRLIRQEIIARQQTIIGKVLSQRVRKDYDAGGGPVWVVDVDVGGERIMRDVLVKGGSDGTTRYADRGQTVALRRNSLGRFDVIGPGDKVIGTTVVIDYVVATGIDNGTGVDFGFSHIARPYSFYRGPTVFVSGAPNFTFTLVGGGNDTLFRSAGSWMTDGFVAGKWIFISGSASNNGAFGPILTPSASTLYFAGDVFSNEGPTAAPIIGHTSRWMDGVNGYPKIAIIDAQGNEV